MGDAIGNWQPAAGIASRANIAKRAKDKSRRPRD
jgi:hypothetical protein